jgi:DNA-binding XRE family transcriptional regulator
MGSLRVVWSFTHCKLTPSIWATSRTSSSSFFLLVPWPDWTFFFRQHTIHSLQRTPTSLPLSRILRRVDFPRQLIITLDIAQRTLRDDFVLASLREQFGRRLRSLRIEHGLSQVALSDLAGGNTGPGFISLIERGISAPSFETIELLASALSVDVPVLFTFPGEENKRRRVAKGTVLKKRGRKPAAKKRGR